MLAALGKHVRVYAWLILAFSVCLREHVSAFGPVSCSCS